MQTEIGDKSACICVGNPLVSAKPSSQICRHSLQAAAGFIKDQWGPPIGLFFLKSLRRNGGA